MPTLVELGARGLAHERVRAVRSRVTGERRDETRWEVSPEGFEEIRSAMADNAALLRADAGLRREAERRAHAKRGVRS